MLAVLIIAYAPLSTLHRHRMITIQEITCKIPLSSFYVEAFLLITFSFSLSYTTREIDVRNPLNEPRYLINQGDVIITGFIGLCFFLSGFDTYSSTHTDIVNIFLTFFLLTKKNHHHLKSFFFSFFYLNS